MHTVRRRRFLAGFLLASLPAPFAWSATEADWQSSVSRAIADGEYHLSLSDATGAFTAPNRAHDFRARWSPDGALTLESRTDAKAWSFSYRLLGVGRGDAHTLPEVRNEYVSDGRIEWRRDGIREWYVNDARGIEQGFVVESRPAGDARDPVVIEGTIAGLLAFPTDDGQSVLFRTPTGRDAMRMRDLSVVDAAGRAMASCFEVGSGSLAIVVDDRDAVYPLTVDSLMTTPAWIAVSPQPGANFGSSVATAGDVNGDGYSDVIIGAQEYDNGEIGEGRAFVYMGSPVGLATTPAWTAESDQAGASFGGSVAVAGDVNGDGYSDVIVGASHFDNGEGDEGRAYLYLGSAAGLLAATAWTAESNQAFADFASSVATAGDVNGDGYSDVIVGAFIYDNGELNEGAAFVYMGSPTGLGGTPAWTTEGNQANTRLGTSGAVASAGDVNGDGYSDVIVGAYLYDNDQVDEGRAFVYLGSAAGLGAVPAWTAESDQTGTWFGRSVATAGDVNGDGYADVIIGADGYDNGETDQGMARVYLGSAAGPGLLPAWTIVGQKTNDRMGSAVATAGDVNGDGYADVIVGASAYDTTTTDVGAAYVYLGSASGIGTTPAWSAEGTRSEEYYGFPVATAGDVNGDGYSDIIVGSEYFGGAFDGRVFVYHGSAAGLAAVESWSAEGGQASASFGSSVATAGDVNGDGFSDVIVGAPYYDNGEPQEGRVFVYLGSRSGLTSVAAWAAESDNPRALFGWSVATAGDINGDGYSDVVVGALKYQNGEVEEGGAFVYEGSPSGLASAGWTAEGNQVFSEYGRAVATAGDVNGDGYSDVIIGAPSYSEGEFKEGSAFVYLGSATGLETVASWTAESNQEWAWFGYAVASARDVNGDGYSDVIVGASHYDNGESAEGRAFVYLGSPTGLHTSAAWTAESNQVDARFGYAATTAGDVNGDGYSDVIVAADGYDGPEIDEGRVFLYLGSLSGLATTVAWTSEPNQANAEFGRSIATAGDINGDGYSDVVIGAPGLDKIFPAEGNAFVYFGSASSLTTTASLVVDTNNTYHQFGASVAMAGDVNGDGYSDLVVGADGYENGEIGEGAAFLYFGNVGDGLDRIPRQARADGSAPIDLLGGTLSTDGFRLRANGRSPFGRDQVRLEWEVKPVATPFDGADIRMSSWFDTGAPGASGSVVPLDELHTPLAGPGPFHWRLRLRSRSPFPWQSHWMSLPYNAITETDLRTENNLARCDLAYADLTFSPLTPARVAPWVYTQSCPAGDVLPTLLVPSIISGTDVDTLGGGPGTLRFYQLSCGCADGIYLTKPAGMVHLDTF